MLPRVEKDKNCTKVRFDKVKDYKERNTEELQDKSIKEGFWDKSIKDFLKRISFEFSLDKYKEYELMEE